MEHSTDPTPEQVQAWARYQEALRARRELPEPNR